MSLKTQIDADIKAAMLAREKDKLTALRAVKSALMLEATKEGAGGEVDDATATKVLQKLHKQRMEAAKIYHEQGREDLASEEEQQAEVLSAYLPEAMSDADLEAAIKKIIADTGASSMKDMGKVMGIASKQLAGKADGSKISGVVKGLLG